MKNFWHYMESVQEDREMEVQSEAFGFDFTVLTTSLSELILLGLIAMAGTTWVGSSIKNWIIEKLNKAKKKGVETDVIGIAYDILKSTGEAIEKLPDQQKKEVLSKLKTMNLKQKRLFKQQMDNAIKEHKKFGELSPAQRKNISDVIIYGNIENMSQIKLLDPKEKQKQKKNSQPK